MSLEFAPQAPKAVSAEDMSTKNIHKLNEQLEGELLKKQIIADTVYGESKSIARKMDERNEKKTDCVVALYEGANSLAALLTRACIRGAQIA